MSFSQPRFVRQKDAPRFFGVTRQTFDKIIRPYFTEIWLGSSAQAGIVYDIYDLNARADIIKERNGRSARKGDEAIWDANRETPVLNSAKDRVLPTGISKAPST